MLALSSPDASCAFVVSLPLNLSKSCMNSLMRIRFLYACSFSLFSRAVTYIWLLSWLEWSAGGKAKRSLVNLQQRLALNDTVAQELEAGDVGGLNKAKGKWSVGNPFLASSLGPEEKEVSLINSLIRAFDGLKQIPPKSTTLPSVLEAFGPAIEASEHGLDVVEDTDGSSRNPRAQALPDERPLVHFKFGFGKKAMFAPVTLVLKSEQFFNE